jgi:hypothetical protein
MKRIYMTLALLGALVTGASAQVDLASFPVIDSNYHMPATGKPFSLTGVFDSNTPGGDSISAAVVYAIAPGSILISGDKVFIVSPASPISSQGVSGWVYTAPTAGVDNTAGTNYLPFTISPALQKSDSIKTLLNITNFEADSNTFSSLLVPRASLVAGKTYGWYGYCTPYQGAFTDSVGSNNFRYIPIIWGGSTSVSEMLNPKLTPLSIFPNPATDNISFKIEFAKNNETTVARILELSGRVINVQNLGSAAAGLKQYSVDVSKLPIGAYSLQIITDNTISVEKFIKK